MIIKNIIIRKHAKKLSEFDKKKGYWTESCKKVIKSAYQYQAKQGEMYAHQLYFLNRFLKSIENKKIITLGAGPGFFAQFLSETKNANAANIDLSLEEIKSGKKLGLTSNINAKAQKLPLKLNSLDAVCAELNFLPEHNIALNDQTRHKIIKQIFQVLKPRGLFLITEYRKEDIDEKMILLHGFKKIARTNKLYCHTIVFQKMELIK